MGIKLAQLGQSSGSLVGEISLEEMWRMVDQIRVGDQGYALVVAANGQLIAHGNSNEKPRVARGDNLATQPLVRLVHGQRNAGPASLEYANDAGVQMLGVAAPLELLGWTVMVEQPRSEAYAVADVLTRQLIFIIGLALLVTVSVGYFFGRSFIQPIFALMRGTHAVAAGRLDERVTITSRDEFKQLGDAFNSMADKLVELTEDVRKKERQAMFGRMAAGLVHDLSHPVQNIGNSCKLIVRVFDDPEYRQTFTRTIDREIDTLKRVLDDLRNVARPAPVERFPLDVNRSVVRHRRIDAGLRRGIRRRARTEIRVRAGHHRRRRVRARARVSQPDYQRHSSDAGRRPRHHQHGPRSRPRRGERHRHRLRHPKRTPRTRSSTTSSRQRNAASAWGSPSPSALSSSSAARSPSRAKSARARHSRCGSPSPSVPSRLRRRPAEERNTYARAQARQVGLD